MDAATLIDSIAALDAAGEGKFEFVHGSLIPVPPQSHDHIDKGWFITTLLKAYVQERGAGYAVGDGFRQRLESGTVRVPKMQPTFGPRAYRGSSRPTARAART